MISGSASKLLWPQERETMASEATGVSLMREAVKAK